MIVVDIHRFLPQKYIFYLKSPNKSLAIFIYMQTFYDISVTFRLLIRMRKEARPLRYHL